MSRMKRIDIFQCYLKDEGRSLIYALRKEYINHFMVLSLKAMVLSDEEKASLRCQVSVRELNESKPYDDISKQN